MSDSRVNRGSIAHPLASAYKNLTLIRFDIIQGLRKLYDPVKDETIREKALELIAAEADLKYRKKYASVWRAK